MRERKNTSWKTIQPDGLGPPWLHVDLFRWVLSNTLCGQHLAPRADGRIKLSILSTWRKRSGLVNTLGNIQPPGRPSYSAARSNRVSGLSVCVLTERLSLHFHVLLSIVRQRRKKEKKKRKTEFNLAKPNRVKSFRINSRLCITKMHSRKKQSLLRPLPTPEPIVERPNVSAILVDGQCPTPNN